jgi:NADPH:quinone reductase-like Zn-dependent oxidoreductase
VNKAEVGFDVGDRVVVRAPNVFRFRTILLTWCCQAYSSGGGFAEYSVVKDRVTAKLPNNLTTKDGATIALQGLTGLSDFPSLALPSLRPAWNSPNPGSRGSSG